MIALDTGDTEKVPILARKAQESLDQKDPASALAFAFSILRRGKPTLLQTRLNHASEIAIQAIHQLAILQPDQAESLTRQAQSIRRAFPITSNVSTVDIHR